MRIRHAAPLLALILGIALIPPASTAKTAQNIPGSEWFTLGTLKAKISALGESDSAKGPVGVLFEFGPVNGLPANQFRMTIDDGNDTLVFGGTYALDEKGKPVLTLDPISAALAFEALWDSVVDELGFGGILGSLSPDITIDKLKLKGKPKEKSSGDQMKIEMKSKWVLEFFIPTQGDDIRVKMKLTLKAKGPRGT